MSLHFTAKMFITFNFTANVGQRGTKEKQLGGGDSTLICLNYVIVIKIINKRLSVI